MDGRRNIKLVLAYDGTNYHGWQRQSGEITIQELIEEKIKIITGESIRLSASGRTDSGVHALHQVCNFITKSGIDTLSLRRALNSLLPDDVHIKHAENVPLEFHSRYSSKSKVYEYRILNSKEPDIFIRNYCWHVTRELSIRDMKECLEQLVGKRDFSCFRSSGSSNLNPVREMIRAGLISGDRGALLIIFEADGFLRHMVRNIVGTIVEAGLGRISPHEFSEILSSKDRRRAGIKAPPHGLFLRMVKY
ncbi:MAG: tRNA pseudouridine(38-40) synthase TruA [Deltaproteobacteria bacterium]|nr:tRNA pseudouridine(38-40) synthase TruA [Deltaproteobacteria bacterium]